MEIRLNRFKSVDVCTSGSNGFELVLWVLTDFLSHQMHFAIIFNPLAQSFLYEYELHYGIIYHVNIMMQIISI